jgi:hypothetical protein
MTKFVTSAEATELSIAVAETFSMPALVLAVTQLQSDGLTARQGGLVGSGFMFCSKYQSDLARIQTLEQSVMQNLLRSTNNGVMGVGGRSVTSEI